VHREKTSLDPSDLKTQKRKKKRERSGIRKKKKEDPRYPKKKEEKKVLCPFEASCIQTHKGRLAGPENNRAVISKPRNGKMPLSFCGKKSSAKVGFRRGPFPPRVPPKMGVPGSLQRKKIAEKESPPT